MTGGSVGTGAATEAARLAALQLKLRLAPVREEMKLSNNNLKTKLMDEADWIKLIGMADASGIDLAAEAKWMGDPGKASMNGYGPWGMGVDGPNYSRVHSYYNFGAGC